jgi:hypothetical protein
MTPEMLQQIANLISTLGFPIVCVIFMWRKITQSDEKNASLLASLTQAINELTIYIKEKDNK